MAQWTYQDKPVSEADVKNYVGFVYLITNIFSNRKYIGKKLFKFTRTKKVKGKKKRTKVKSDWETYFGSNKELLADVTKLGEDSFRREILHLCSSKGMCNYLEAKEQMLSGALESDDYYNDWIMVKVHRSHMKKST